MFQRHPASSRRLPNAIKRSQQPYLVQLDISNAPVDRQSPLDHRDPPRRSQTVTICPPILKNRKKNTRIFKIGNLKIWRFSWDISWLKRPFGFIFYSFDVLTSTLELQSISSIGTLATKITHIQILSGSNHHSGRLHIGSEVENKHSDSSRILIPDR